MNYKFFAWLNVLLLGIQLLPYLMAYANKHFLNTKNPAFSSLMRGFRRYHKLTGAALLISSVIHGYLALGGLRLHTGTILFAALLISAAFGIIFRNRKQIKYLKIHRAAAAVILLLFLIHFFIPNAVYYVVQAFTGK